MTVIHAPAMLTGLGRGRRAMIARRSPAQRKSGVQGVPEKIWDRHAWPRESASISSLW